MIPSRVDAYEYADPSADHTADPALWSAAEVAVGISSGSIPSLGHLFQRAIAFTKPRPVGQSKNHVAPPRGLSRTGCQGDDDSHQHGKFWMLREESGQVSELELDQENTNSSSRRELWV